MFTVFGFILLIGIVLTVISILTGTTMKYLVPLVVVAVVGFFGMILTDDVPHDTGNVTQNDTNVK